MARFELLDPRTIEPPAEAMRSTSFMEGMPEFLADIAARGVTQPIGVRDKEDGTYEVIWGARRTYASLETGRPTIPAMVYAANEQDTDELMAIENLLRTNVNAAEEADMYQRLIRKRNMSVAGVAAQLNVPGARVAKLLAIKEGDPEVLEALAQGNISVAQAEAINKFSDEIGRKQALHYAWHSGTSAQMLRTWQEERKASGLDVQMEALAEQLQDGTIPDYRNQARCTLCDTWKNLHEVIHRVICTDDWELMVDLYTRYQQQISDVDKRDNSTVVMETRGTASGPDTELPPFVSLEI